jgi:hypothetical protein
MEPKLLSRHSDRWMSGTEVSPRSHALSPKRRTPDIGFTDAAILANPAIPNRIPNPTLNPADGVQTVLAQTKPTSQTCEPKFLQRTDIWTELLFDRRTICLADLESRPLCHCNLTERPAPLDDRQELTLFTAWLARSVSP